MTLRSGRFFTLRWALVCTSFSSSAVVAVASLSGRSVAVGPISRLPWTVGVTSTPLPILPGSWKMVRDTSPPASLSSRQ